MSSTEVTGQTVAATKGRPCDARSLLRLLAVGGISPAIGLREVVDCGDGIQGRIGIRGGHKLLVRLNALDLFDVEIGHITRRIEWNIDRQAHNVDAANLCATIRTLVEGVLR